MQIWEGELQMPPRTRETRHPPGKPFPGIAESWSIEVSLGLLFAALLLFLSFDFS